MQNTVRAALAFLRAQKFLVVAACTLILWGPMAHANRQDCTSSGVSCNVYGSSTYSFQNGIGGICMNFPSLACKPNDISSTNCRSLCLYDFAQGYNTPSPSCTTTSGTSGMCSCGQGPDLSSSPYSTAYCANNGPSGAFACNSDDLCSAQQCPSGQEILFFKNPNSPSSYASAYSSTLTVPTSGKPNCVSQGFSGGPGQVWSQFGVRCLSSGSGDTAHSQFYCNASFGQFIIMRTGGDALDCSTQTSACTPIVSPSSTPGGPTGSVSPSPDPAPPAPTCNTSLGGEGRACSDATECALCGNVCDVGGNQPLLHDKTCAPGSSGCVTGVSYNDDSGGVVSQTVAPLKMCVKAANVPSSPDQSQPPKATQSNLDKSLINVDGKYLRCILESNEQHRIGVGCKCASNYSPMVMTTADFSTITYLEPKKPTHLNILWAQIQELLKANPKTGKNIQASINRVIFPAWADSSPAPASALMYSDESPIVYKVSDQGYGTGTNTGAGQVVGCARDCPGGISHVLGKPLDCQCGAGQAFDAQNWACVSCPEGGYIPQGATECQCPQGYEVWPAGATPGKCRPVLPSAEFSRDTNGYPVCGAKRAPMTYDLTGTSYSGGSTPRTTKKVTLNLKDYPYAELTAAPSPGPSYYYANYTHCGCTTSNIPATPITPDNPTDPAPTPQWIAPDDYTTINNRGADSRPIVASYGMVAIANDGTSDGRLGSVYSLSNSQCGCPNINEVLRADGKCVPMVDLTDEHIRFAKYDHTTEPSVNVLGGTNQSVDKILLPFDNTNSGSSIYTRGIWKCDLGYTLTGTPAKCVFDKSKHMCDATSKVSKFVGGSTDAEQFANARNKKLACCMNDIGSMGGTGSGSIKFDCIENAQKTYADFNALWASSDAEDEGGQINAFALADAGGKLASGFYTLNGVRCAEYSEFSADPIQPGRVNPIVSMGQGNAVTGGADFVAVGGTIPVPTGSGYGFMVSKLGSVGKAPSTTAERRRCPVLVRAATLITCPKNPNSENVSLKTFEDKAVTPWARRCSVASGIQIKVRVEQVWEIAGQPKLQPIDTVLDGKNGASISIDRILQKKFGNGCPANTTRQGDACVY